MQEPIIYLDVLLLLNLFVNYFLLLSVQHLAHLAVSHKRMLCAAGLGSLFSVVVLFPPFPFLLLLICRFSMSILITSLAFGMPSLPIVLKNTILFWGISFLFGGLLFALWYFITPSGMILRNGSIYFSVSAVTLTCSILAAYFFLQLLSSILSKQTPCEQTVPIKVTVNGNEVLLTALQDTGNQLSDWATGLPVVICEQQSLSPLFPQDVNQSLHTLSLENIHHPQWKKKFHILPINTASGKSSVAAFRPDQFQILTDPPCSQSVMIGISEHPLSDGSFSALMNSALVSKP